MTTNKLERDGYEIDETATTVNPKEQTAWTYSSTKLYTWIIKIFHNLELCYIYDMEWKWTRSIITSVSKKIQTSTQNPMFVTKSNQR